MKKTTQLIIATVLSLNIVSVFGNEQQQQEIGNCLLVQKGLLNGEIIESTLYRSEESTTYRSSQDENTIYKERKIKTHLYTNEQYLLISESFGLETIVTEEINALTYYETTNTKYTHSGFNYITQLPEKTFSEVNKKVLFKKDGDIVRSIYIQENDEYMDYVIEKKEIYTASDMRQTFKKYIYPEETFSQEKEFVLVSEECIYRR